MPTFGECDLAEQTQTVRDAKACARHAPHTQRLLNQRPRSFQIAQMQDGLAQHAERSAQAHGVVGSTRAAGPTVGWSGHPHLRGWITHHAPNDAQWQVDLLDHRAVAGDITALDGVFLAARREVLKAVPFDAALFDGFHLGDIDWSLRASRVGFRLGVAADLGLVHASRGNYDATWQRYADRFCTKHSLGTTPPAPSFFFGAKLDGPDQIRAFFDLLRGMGTGY